MLALFFSPSYGCRQVASSRVMYIFAITSHQYTTTLYTPGHLPISWDVFARKSADILSFRISFITISIFRPCAMCVPDLGLICEIMLVAEGFLEARNLSRKFITLYKLCKELLSKQDHYDWGLRAIKSVLVVAGNSTPV